MAESLSTPRMQTILRELRKVPCDERICEILSELKSLGVVEELNREQNEVLSRFLDEDHVDFDPDEVCRADIVLAFYNDKHGTEYKPVNGFCDEALSKKDGTFRHVTFLAATDESGSVPQRFFAVLVCIPPARRHVILSCIIENSKRLGCCTCDYMFLKGPSLMQYGPSYLSPTFLATHINNVCYELVQQCLIEVLVFGLKSDDEKPILDLPRIALAYYNKRRKENYEFVEALGMYGSVGVDLSGIAVHLNFKAKPHSPGHHQDSDTKIFFAEVFRVKIGVWKVLTFSILGSKRNAGCHMCEGPKTRKVLHPCGRFRYGSYGYKSRSLRRLHGRP